MSEPIYFARRVSRGDPILPLLIASLPATQTTLLIASQSITQEHDRFIDVMYKGLHTRSRSPLSFQRRSFGGAAVTLLTFHTEASDGSRAGLLLSFGAVTTPMFARQHPEAIAKYMDLYLRTANRLFGTQLPQSGSQRLLEMLRTDGHARELTNLAETLLLASTVVAEIWIPQRKSYLPRLPTVQRAVAIIYPDESLTSDAMRAFVHECARRSARNWTLDGTVAGAYGIPPDVLRQAHGVKLVRRGNLRYLVLTRRG